MVTFVDQLLSLTRSFLIKMESTKAEIASLKRKIEDIEADIDAVKAGRGIWSDAPMTERRSYLDTLRKDKISLQEEKNILLKQTPEGMFNSFKSDEV